MIRVYEYGCLQPIAGEQQAKDQMWRRNRLWNHLVELEKNHREEAAKLLSDEGEQAEIKRLMDYRQSLREQIKLKRQAARSKKVDVSELRAEIRQTKETLGALIQAAKESRRQRVTERKAQLEEMSVARRAQVKAVTKVSELYWCNYDEVLASHEIARKNPEGLSFHRFAGQGKVSIRYQTGLAAEAVFGDDTRLRIRSLTPEELAATGYKKPKARHIVSIRVGSTGRAPIWFELPVVLHRPLPETGVVRSASVKREMIGPKAHYKLLITVDDRVTVEAKPLDKVAAVDVGWRKVPDGLRVAYWADADGNHGSCVLNNEILWEFERVRTLQSTIDTKFDEIKLYIRENIKAGALQIPTEELRQEISNLYQWKSPGRLFSWARRAKEAGFEDATLSKWMTKQRHLYEWVSNLRAQVHLRRREQYRVFASQITKKYGRIILEDFDLRRVAEKPEPEADGQNYAARNRQIASISEFRTTLRSTAAREGCTINTVEAAMSTRRCHLCQYEAAWDAAESVIHRCLNCTAAWDQDYNACRNLLFADSPAVEAAMASA